MTPKVQAAYLRKRIARTLGGPMRGVLSAARPDPGPDTPDRPDAAAPPVHDEGSWLAILDSYPQDLQQVAQALRSAKDALNNTVRKGFSTHKVWLPSFVALGAADAVSVSQRATRAIPGLGAVGAVAGVGMLAASAQDYRKSKTLEQKLDAGGDFAWGLQGLLYLGSSTAQAGKAVVGFGVAGALVQTSAGVIRIKRGIERHDGEMVKLGALDLAGGLLWLGWDLIGWQQPLFVASYVVLMVGREAYANKQALKKLGNRVANDARDKYAAACESVVTDLKQVMAELRRRSDRGALRLPEPEAV
jgi:hypothetical protein